MTPEFAVRGEASLDELLKGVVVLDVPAASKWPDIRWATVLPTQSCEIRAVQSLDTTA